MIDSPTYPLEDDALIELTNGAGLKIVQTETVAIVRWDREAGQPVIETQFPPASFLIQECGDEDNPPCSVLQTGAGKFRVSLQPPSIDQKV